MTQKSGRYSVFLRPLAYAIDLTIILVLALQFNFSKIEYIYFAGFTTIGWLFLSIRSDFYEIYRFTKATRIISLGFLQIILFGLVVFSFFGVFKDLARSVRIVLNYLTQTFIAILFAKLAIYYLLQRYRKYLGKNFRTLIIIGENKKALELRDFFLNNPIYGYQFKKSFIISPGNSSSDKGVNLSTCIKYVLEEEVDEIYCSPSALSNKQIQQLVNFSDNNLKVLKFIPGNSTIYTRKLKLDYYDYMPILSFRNIPIHDSLNKAIKRSFDVVLSLFVIIFLLSWITPLLAIIIRLDSKGPIFFRQLRNGLDNKEFYCYKFRSMSAAPKGNNHHANKKVKPVTPFGRFIRKTSIDELPQFFNVLVGNMSVVGPRPHMIRDTDEFAERVDKYMVRHFIKPGITGLAQVKGYRGQIEKQEDIVHRVKYDIFYVENWSLLLDINIIIKTIYNAFKGEEKAY